MPWKYRMTTAFCIITKGFFIGIILLQSNFSHAKLFSNSRAFLYFSPEPSVQPHAHCQASVI